MAFGSLIFVRGSAKPPFDTQIYLRMDGMFFLGTESHTVPFWLPDKRLPKYDTLLFFVFFGCLISDVYTDMGKPTSVVALCGRLFATNFKLQKRTL